MHMLTNMMSEWKNEDVNCIFLFTRPVSFYRYWSDLDGRRGVYRDRRHHPPVQVLRLGQNQLRSCWGRRRDMQHLTLPPFSLLSGLLYVQDCSGAADWLRELRGRCCPSPGHQRQEDQLKPHFQQGGAWDSSSSHRANRDWRRTNKQTGTLTAFTTKRTVFTS